MDRLEFLVVDKEESVEVSLQEHSYTGDELEKGVNICEEDTEVSRSDHSHEFRDASSRSRRRSLCGEERVWSPVLSVMVASLPALLFGCTLGFPSPVLLDLMKLDQEKFRFDTLLSDLFSVSYWIMGVSTGRRTISTMILCNLYKASMRNCLLSRANFNPRLKFRLHNKAHESPEQYFQCCLPMFL